MLVEPDFHTFDLAHLLNNASVVPENCEHAFSSRGTKGSVSLRNQSLQLFTSKNNKFIWRCDEIQISFKKVSFGRFILYYSRIF